MVDFMSLNIKDPEAHKLAQELARETGESMTFAVIQAIRERLEAVRRRRMRDAMHAAIMAIGKRGASLYKGPDIDHADLLYDDKGLPK
jgi:antitoxin VapB